MPRTIIEITEDSACKITIEDSNGLKSIKYLSFTNTLNLLNASIRESSETHDLAIGDTRLSTILPGDNIISTIQIKEFVDSGSTWYILLREGVPANFKYKNKTYKNVAMPKTLFAIKVFNDRCCNIKIAAVKTNRITNNTTIYRYPFSNVFDTRNVCLGSNTFSDFDLNGIQNLPMIPEMFLAMTNNNDGYCGSNTSNLNYEELLEVLSESTFDNDILRESYTSKTYNDFINTLR